MRTWKDWLIATLAIGAILLFIHAMAWLSHMSFSEAGVCFLVGVLVSNEIGKKYL
jgi:hypothetical protein